MLLQIPQVLSSDQLVFFRARLAMAPWADGRITAGHQSGKAKDNEQLPENHPVAIELGALVREALKKMGRADLIGNGKQHLIPLWQPAGDGGYVSARRKNSTPAPTGAPRKGTLLTQHTGLPPRVTGSADLKPRRARPGKS